MRLTIEELLSDGRFRAPSGDLNHEAASALAISRDTGRDWVEVDEPTPADEVVDSILEAKRAAGQAAYLWLHSSGDCILWASREDAESDPTGIGALGRWQLSPAVADALAETGEAEED